MEEIDNATSIIASASGREHFACFRTSQSTQPGAAVFAVEICGNSWDRRVLLSNAEMVPDFLVRLPQVLINEQALLALCKKLEEWMQNRSSFTCALSPDGYNDQALEVALSPGAELISSMEKPIFRIEYRRGLAMIGRWAFVVDQSCIRNFYDSLKALVASSTISS